MQVKVTVAKFGVDPDGSEIEQYDEAKYEGCSLRQCLDRAARDFQAKFTPGIRTLQFTVDKLLD